VWQDLLTPYFNQNCIVYEESDLFSMNNKYKKLGVPSTRWICFLSQFGLESRNSNFRYYIKGNAIFARNVFFFSLLVALVYFTLLTSKLQGHLRQKRINVIFFFFLQKVKKQTTERMLFDNRTGASQLKRERNPSSEILSLKSHYHSRV